MTTEISAEALAKVIGDHVHPDGWGVDCVYVSQLYEAFPGLQEQVAVRLAEVKVEEAQAALERRRAAVTR